MKWGEIHNYCISQTSRNTPHKVDSVDIAQQHNPQPYTKYVMYIALKETRYMNNLSKPFRSSYLSECF